MCTGSTIRTGGGIARPRRGWLSQEKFVCGMCRDQKAEPGRDLAPRMITRPFQWPLRRPPRRGEPGCTLVDLFLGEVTYPQRLFEDGFHSIAHPDLEPPFDHFSADLKSHCRLPDRLPLAQHGKCDKPFFAPPLLLSTREGTEVHSSFDQAPEPWPPVSCPGTIIQHIAPPCSRARSRCFIQSVDSFGRSGRLCADANSDRAIPPRRVRCDRL